MFMGKLLSAAVSKDGNRELARGTGHPADYSMGSRGVKPVSGRRELHHSR